MPTLYGTLGSPFVRKAIVALTEKGIKYDHDPVIPFAPNPEYRKIHPLGRIPAYRDGDRVLPDSSVILAYLERTHPERKVRRGEIADAILANQLIDGIDHFHGVGSGLALNLKHDRAGVVDPGDFLVVLDAVEHAPQVTQADRGSVLVRDNKRAVLLGVQ